MKNVVAHTFNPRQWQADLCKFMASLVYVMHSRLAKAI